MGIMNEMKKQMECAEDATNIFKAVLFELFGNVQEIVVEASSMYGGDYALNLDVFAKRIICSPALPKSLESIVVKGSEWLPNEVPQSVANVCEERGWKVANDGKKKEFRFSRC